MNTPTKKHRILITNDDGIHAPGLALLESIAKEITDDVWVVAPDGERSGAGHSVSLTLPIRMRQLAPRRYQVTGTPTDCVLMALWEFMSDGPPTVILSGINAGANLAEDVSYSGTCAAAMEGTLLGIRSIAMSQIREPGSVADFAPAAAHAPALIKTLVDTEQWPQGSFLNINFPNCPPDAVQGVEVTGMGQRPPGAFKTEGRTDARNQPYFWVRISYPPGDYKPGTDLAATAENRISLSPIRMDFTDREWHRSLQALF